MKDENRQKVWLCFTKFSKSMAVILFVAFSKTKIFQRSMSSIIHRASSFPTMYNFMPPLVVQRRQPRPNSNIDFGQKKWNSFQFMQTVSNKIILDIIQLQILQVNKKVKYFQRFLKQVAIRQHKSCESRRLKNHVEFWDINRVCHRRGPGSSATLILFKTLLLADKHMQLFLNCYKNWWSYNCFRITVS